ncbi:MAG: hypothetical protein LH630_09565 [Actinomycetia bacterium]|nr:hypothetical protein [Actinomycetes bacterium]
MTSARHVPGRGDPSDAELLAGDQERRNNDAELTERLEVERASTSWHELLAGSLQRVVEVVTGDGVRHRGRVVDVGDGWFLLEVAGRAVLIPSCQVLTVGELRRREVGSVVRRGMGSVLRTWARMQCMLTVHLLDGSSRNGRVTDVLADAFTLAPDSDFEGPLTIPRAAIRWVVGDGVNEE